VTCRDPSRRRLVPNMPAWAPVPARTPVLVTNGGQRPAHSPAHVLALARSRVNRYRACPLPSPRILPYCVRMTWTIFACVAARLAGALAGFVVFKRVAVFAAVADPAATSPPAVPPPQAASATAMKPASTGASDKRRAGVIGLRGRRHSRSHLVVFGVSRSNVFSLSGQSFGACVRYATGTPAAQSGRVSNSARAERTEFSVFDRQHRHRRRRRGGGASGGLARGGLLGACLAAQ
jgi:hypothetical protein